MDKGDQQGGPSDARKALAENLKALMKSHHLDVYELADKAGISHKTIRRMLDAEGKSPRLENLDAVAGAFNLETWKLLKPSQTEKDGEHRVSGNEGHIPEKDLYSRGVAKRTKGVRKP